MSFYLIFSAILSACFLLANSQNRSIDYPGIGLFDLSGHFDTLPADPSTIHPTFTLYTRENLHEGESLLWNDTQSILASSTFDGSRPSKVIIHGFVETPTSRSWIGRMKDRLLEVLDVNVLIVNWSTNKANSGKYGQAASNTQVVGPLIAIQIQAICALKGCSGGQFHLIGQSLGAHVAGFAGKFLHGTLGQITGLDPAGPCFSTSSPEARLWYTDAHFVDVVHTDARAVMGLGMEEPCGTVDFYPNGARRQAGCGWQRVRSFFKGKGTRTLFACEHYRSWTYYIEAITKLDNPEKMKKAIAHQCENYQDYREGKCDDCGEEGEHCAWFGLRAAEFEAKGENRIKFYFNTAASEPYLE